MATTYLVLDLPIETTEEVVIDQLLAALDEIGGPDAEFAEEEHQTTPTQTLTRFTNESADAIVTIWHDNIARLRYLEVAMPTEERLNAATAAIRRHFVIVDHQDVLDRIAASGQDTRLADNIFYQLAYSAPDHASAPTIRTLTQSLASPESSRRMGAATAVGVLGWRDLAGPLGAAFATEKDGAVRDAMERASRVFA